MRDPEIAVRLGVTVGDLKHRIERLVRLAGVDSRSALAGWDPESPPAPAEEAAPPDARQRRRPPLVTTAVTLGMGVLAAGLLSAYLLTQSESKAPAGEAEAAEVPASSLVSDFPVQRLRFVPAGQFPSDLLLYVLRDCPSCTAPVALDRIYRDPAGNTVSEVIYRADAEAGQYILSVWAQRDASDVIVAVCDSGSCGGRRPLTADAATRFHRSRDGGATWVDVGAVPGVADVVSGGAERVVLARVEQADGRVTYHAVGAEDQSAAELISPGPPPDFLLIGQLDQVVVQGLSRIVTSATGVFAYSWYPEASTPDMEGVATRLGIATRFGTTVRMFEYVGAPLELGVWADAYTVTAAVAMSPGVTLTESPTGQPPRMHIPVLVDISRGTVTALAEPFSNTRYLPAINQVVAAVRGEFGRISARAEGCVPLLRSWSRDSGERVCLVEGTLVTFVETRLAGNEEWMAIRAPTGLIGWVRPEDQGGVWLPE
jgi:hypothetical protein